MTDFNSTGMLDLNQYLNGTGSSAANEEHQLQVASLMNDLNNIRHTQ